MQKHKPALIRNNAKAVEKIRNYYLETGQKVPPTIANKSASKGTITSLIKRVNNEKKTGVDKYRIKYNEIKPFTSLKLNPAKLSPAQKGKITRIRKEVSAPLATGGFSYSPRSKKNQKVLRDSLGFKSKEITKALLVSDDGKTTKASVKKGRLHIESDVSESENFTFNKNDLLLFGEDYINEFLDDLHEKGWTRFRIMTGGGELSNGHAFTLGRAKNKFRALLNLPAITGENIGGSGANHEQWMLGVKAVRFKPSDLSVAEINQLRKAQRDTGYGRRKRAELKKKKGK